MLKRLTILLLTITLSLTTITACNTANQPLTEEDFDEMAQRAFDYFVEFSKIPRGSKNEKAISDWVVAFSEERGLEYFQDNLHNVIVKKPGSSGRENDPPVILQAHIDMVCEKNEGVDHDFLTDPIIPIIDGDWVYADGTTLGADDGAGMAMILLVLDADNISHPPIEALFTTDEEAGMSGAAGVDTSKLSAMRLINIDAEEEGIFYVSSAAATFVDTTIPVELEPLPDGYTTFMLTLKGLPGGHSGLNIGDGIPNANLLMAKLLNDLGLVGMRLTSIDGGNAPNAIPRECSAVVSFPVNDVSGLGDLSNLDTILAQAEESFKDQYPNAPELEIVIEPNTAPQSVMTVETADMVLSAITQMPNGVISMSADIEGLVQTSSNLGVIITEGDTVTIRCCPRSSVASEQEQTIADISAVADEIGATVGISNDSPAWSYNPDSPLREKMIEVYTEMYGEAPSPEAVHAGLETGMFAGTIPGIDMISIGPDITGAHSPDERMSLSSFGRVLEFLIKVLAEI